MKKKIISRTFASFKVPFTTNQSKDNYLNSNSVPFRTFIRSLVKQFKI